MTTRDDLVDKATAWEAISAKNAELRTVLEAKDAEIARLKEEMEDLKDDYLRRHKDACDRLDRIIELERQLAAETERCAFLVECSPRRISRKDIAAAIRGGAK